jgi:GAF domain-containing protein
MAENESCNRWAPNRPSLHRQSHAKKKPLLHREKGILELISLGAPLPEVLNNLCAALDLQIGNVVSVILPADDQELPTITQNALQFGLHVFWSASIPLRNEDVLGSLQTYCCVSRSPTPFELQLIERVTHLATLAIRRHNDEENFASFSRNWTNALRRDSHERAYMN